MAQTHDGCALKYKFENKWVEVNWTEYQQKIFSAYHFFKNKNVVADEKIALISTTRWEWAATDLTLMGMHAVVVPIYPNITIEELDFILKQSGCSKIIFEGDVVLNQLKTIEQNQEKEFVKINIDEVDFNSWTKEELQKEFLNLCLTLSPTQIATIVYTSGTTGHPKGAVILHEAIVSEVVESFQYFGVKKNYTSLTFLPFAHVLGRIEHLGGCYNGHCVAYAESIDKLSINLKEIQPDFIVAVPRIFEKIYSHIQTTVETNSLKKKLLKLALNYAEEIKNYRKTKQQIPWGLMLSYQTLQQLIFNPILKAFGGNLKFAVSGGAPINSDLLVFFENCGVQILEGYGLTETFAAACVNTLTYKEIGTVGKPIGDVEIKIAEDGEILIKSKKCLKEYYQNPEETKNHIVDGFFKTGDIGHLTETGFLKITDRKKNLIKTANAKYVAPQKLENLIKEEPLISQVLIVGNNRKFISCLISIDSALVQNWAKQNNIEYSDLSELKNHILLQNRIKKHMQNVNAKLAHHETIKKYEILVDDWTVENGGLTPSLKLKRQFLELKYAEIIEHLYD